MNEELKNIILDYLQSQGYECNSSQSDWEKLFNNPEIFGKNWINLVNNEVGSSIDNFIQYQIKYNPDVKQIVSQYQYTPTLEEVKKNLLETARNTVSQELGKTDYKVIRQVEMNTLSEQDFANLKMQRQLLRDKFNDYEIEVNQATTIEELNGIEW